LSDSVRAVERSLDILLCFSRQTPELTMTQIAEQIGLHKSTVHRLLATLEKRRFVERDLITGNYRLGIRILQMAYLTLEHNSLRRFSTPFLRNLCEQYQETIHLAVLDDADVVFVNIFESPQRVKLAAALGQRLPAFATASGKAMLAYMPDDAVWRILNDGMPRYTQYTPQTPEEFFEDLRQIRDQGFAISVMEYEDEINAVAAPIFDMMSHQPLASVAIAGPSYRLTQERMVQIGPFLSEIVQRITREFGMAAQPQT
jgi:DNA-binding IclR family transcriptional regulator